MVGNIGHATKSCRRRQFANEISQFFSFAGRFLIRFGRKKKPQYSQLEPRSQTPPFQQQLSNTGQKNNEAQSTQDAGRDACVNSNVFPLMLLACSVDTPIHINRSHLLASRCASVPRPVWIGPVLHALTTMTMDVNENLWTANTIIIGVCDRTQVFRSLDLFSSF